MVTEAATAAATSAFTTATTWAAESALGVWIKDTYATTEIAVVGIFSKEKAAKLKRDLEVARNKAKAAAV